MQDPTQMQQQPQPQDPSISAGINQPDLSSQSLLQQMQPNDSMQLQMQALQQAQFEHLPDYNTPIKSILQFIQQITQEGQQMQTMDLNVSAESIYKLSQAVHLLAQSNSEEGEAIPARIQVRLEGAKLQMQQQESLHGMMLNEQQQNRDHALKLQQQNHQQILDTQQQAHEQALAQAMQQHQMQLAQQAQQQQASQPSGGSEG
jgi:hypothetical protein